MVTNIDLSSPEAGEKKTISGKPALIFSVVVLVVVFGLYLGMTFLSSKYVSEEKSVSEQISQEQAKISGTEFSDALDFEERLNLLDKAIGDHGYWDNLLVNMSGYMIPEVRLNTFSAQRDSSGSAVIELGGVAASLDALSRELILLKNFPNASSLEFKNASNQAGEEGQAGGISFSATLKVNKEAFQK